MGPPGASVSGPPVRVLCALCSVLEACWGQGSYCWEEGTGLTPRGGPGSMGDGRREAQLPRRKTTLSGWGHLTNDVTDHLHFGNSDC